ncbi:UDP-N-acetylenolpyruvoylglucosamine reductase [Bacillus pseudomycoides]|uniref:UDP-N-acetylenolpyruvoylglucosamine reductase n=1 Tax=Bacillus pseudomycoides TaxID=64104 RepID=A0AA91VCH5_9BACI|nr:MULTISPECIES: UDP-N-acetylmuramate dehydrogenase [Bacillus]PEB55990.1 UDP-N-acetylenolpyruvoylglucosamine reductase [Bacillus sp. AFS098217]PED82693.1 UDP-N-acetylenolpyruvoylglucosamine reductase [Bacillus pseudomycoides]PEU07577.1 UDP-N-acetylenolpyruvoylglucosamine reductase [Bacillus sp. AFS019443]PEU13112.1 UDP-N-acetylenolpyruvoylglucosamine reductase [Bacillus sp. AFS014408]PFW61488.1 UDP-N-acetylenolpyruvoylglucosamine reductase [Bacillus sp. AFS075034]
MNMQEVYKYLRTILPEGHVKQDEMLKDHTHIKVGGKADVFVIPTTYTEIQQVVQYANINNIPITFLGNGSNVIIKDGGIRGIILSLTHITDITVNEQTIVAQSGAAIIDVSRTALEHSLTGLEFACGIPGSVGGALYMNAGAYGGEVAYVLTKAVVMTKEGELLTLSKDDFDFGYRKSTFANNHYIILEGTFELEKGVYAEIKEKMDDLTYKRESKQPLEYPSCGSVFKRPPNHFAGKLIQDSGLQGKRIGGVEVSVKHAGFMVNVDNGTAQDYIDLIHFVQKTVQEKFDVTLEREVRIIGEDLV